MDARRRRDEGSARSWFELSSNRRRTSLTPLCSPVFRLAPRIPRMRTRTRPLFPVVTDGPRVNWVPCSRGKAAVAGRGFFRQRVV